jgi:purine nucleoside permease
MSIVTQRRRPSCAGLGKAFALLGIALGASAATAADVPAAQAPWPVKVVVVTTYENGEDSGDKPGELQLWVEREALSERIEFPGGVRALRTNKDHSIVAVVTGMGLVNAGASVMALAFDRRFDVRKAYWLVAGVAGIDPAVGTIGDAAWADYVVNDLAKSMDMREAPAGWPYAIYPFRSAAAGKMPYEKLDYGPSARYAQVFPLDPGLTRWAYALTKDVKLDASPEMLAAAKAWRAFPSTQQPPKVRIGASLASNHYWHGAADTRWARDWVRMFSDGKATFTTSDMEDSAIAAAMARLDRMGAADAKRLLVLRTAANYTMAPPGMTTFESANATHAGQGLPAYEAAHRVGSRVVHELIAHWPRYADQVPTAP